MLEVNRIPPFGSLYNRLGLCYLQSWGSPFVHRVPGYLKTLIIHLHSIGLYMYLKKSLLSGVCIECLSLLTGRQETNFHKFCIWFWGRLDQKRDCHGNQKLTLTCTCVQNLIIWTIYFGVITEKTKFDLLKNHLQILSDKVFALCKRTHFAKYSLPYIHCQRNIVRGNVA